VNILRLSRMTVTDTPPVTHESSRLRKKPGILDENLLPGLKPSLMVLALCGG
jgi:hypothetical protein